jgi:hypothetical protein
MHVCMYVCVSPLCGGAAPAWLTLAELFLSIRECLCACMCVCMCVCVCGCVTSGHALQACNTWSSRCGSNTHRLGLLFQQLTCSAISHSHMVPMLVQSMASLSMLLEFIQLCGSNTHILGLLFRWAIYNISCGFRVLTVWGCCFSNGHAERH